MTFAMQLRKTRTYFVGSCIKGVEIRLLIDAGSFFCLGRLL
jgi:hypothetical protein